MEQEMPLWMLLSDMRRIAFVGQNSGLEPLLELVEDSKEIDCLAHAYWLLGASHAIALIEAHRELSEQTEVVNRRIREMGLT